MERGIFTFKYEWLARQPPCNLTEALELGDSYPHYYNTERPHQGRACQNQTSDEAFPSLPILPQLPETIQPDSWLKAYHGHVYRRRVSAAGTIQLDCHLYSVGAAYAKQNVLVHLDAEQACFFASSGENVIKCLPLKGLYGGEMDFASYLIVMQAEARTVEYHRHIWWENLAELA